MVVMAAQHLENVLNTTEFILNNGQNDMFCVLRISPELKIKNNHNNNTGLVS